MLSTCRRLGAIRWPYADVRPGLAWPWVHGGEQVAVRNDSTRPVIELLGQMEASGRYVCLAGVVQAGDSATIVCGGDYEPEAELG